MTRWQAMRFHLWCIRRKLGTTASICPHLLGIARAILGQ